MAQDVLVRMITLACHSYMPRAVLRPSRLCAILTLIAFVSLARAQSSTVESRLDIAAATMAYAENLGDLGPEQRKRLVEFVTGNIVFVLTHELGHAVVSEMGLPVLGRLEDAADSFAIITMLEMGSEMSVRTLVEATRGWFLSSRRDAAEQVNVRYFDAHSLSSQRAYQIVCLMVGSDPTRFDMLAERVNMPVARRQTCAADFSNAAWSWNMLLKQHLRGPASMPTAIAVRYQTGTGDLAVYERAIRATQMFEIMARNASLKFKWRAPLNFEARSCGTPNAYWNLPSRTLVFCYELAADFARLFRQYGLTVGASRGSH